MAITWRRSSNQLERTDDYCVRCFSDRSLLDHEAPGGPRCVNQTRRAHSSVESRRRIGEFAKRFKLMPEPKRRLWIETLKREVPEMFKLDVDSGETFG